MSRGRRGALLCALAGRWRRRVEPPFLVHDQPRPAAEGEKRPGPLQHYQQAVAKAGQVVDMDEQPDEPGQETLEFEAADLGDGPAAADRGHLAFVREVKLAPRLAPQLAENRLRHEPPLLHG